jgi:hypothetical protein
LSFILNVEEAYFLIDWILVKWAEKMFLSVA